MSNLCPRYLPLKSLGHHYTLVHFIIHLLSIGEALLCFAKFEYKYYLNLIFLNVTSQWNVMAFLYFSSDNYNCTKDVEETKRSDSNHWRCVRSRSAGRDSSKSLEPIFRAVVLFPKTSLTLYLLLEIQFCKYDLIC